MERALDPRKHGYDLVLAPADYPARDGPPARSLIVCTQQRSGSTLLGESIYFAGGFGCPLEYLHLGFRPQFERRWQTSGLRDYVSQLYRLRTSSSGTFAIKLFWRDLLDLAREYAPAEFGGLPRGSAATMASGTQRRLFEILSELFPNPRFVHLTRKDSVRQAVSFVVAGQTNRWRKFSDRKRDDPEIEYVFGTILRMLALIQKNDAHWLDFFRANDLPYYAIAYEGLAADYEGTLRPFFAWLGRPDAPIVPPRLQVQSDEHTEALLERFTAEFRRRATRMTPDVTSS